MAVILNEDRCTGCGKCKEVCPVEAITVESKAQIQEDVCIECGACVEECPEKALSLP